MSNFGYCSIIVKKKDSINELVKILDLMKILKKNYDAEKGCSYLHFLYSNNDLTWCLASDVIDVKDNDNYIRIETHFNREDAVCHYLKLKGIDFIYNFSDELHGMGGYTNDTTGEFFKPFICVMFEEGDEVAVDIPIDATKEYIDAKINEIETQHNRGIMHCYICKYHDVSYFDIDDTNRENFEKQIEEMLSDVIE